MSLLLDEMYAGLKEYFETLGWQALTVQDAELKGAKDKDIVEYAKKQQPTACDPRSETSRPIRAHRSQIRANIQRNDCKNCRYKNKRKVSKHKTEMKLL